MYDEQFDGAVPLPATIIIINLWAEFKRHFFRKPLGLIVMLIFGSLLEILNRNEYGVETLGRFPTLAEEISLYNKSSMQISISSLTIGYSAWHTQSSPNRWDQKSVI